MTNVSPVNLDMVRTEENVVKCVLRLQLKPVLDEFLIEAMRTDYDPKDKKKGSFEPKDPPLSTKMFAAEISTQFLAQAFPYAT